MNTTIKVAPRQRLVAERLRRRWTQQEVADRLGTTAGNVSRWERGLTSPGPYFRRKLCELFGRSAQELGLTWDGSDETLSPHTQAAAASPPFFTGREELLALLHTLMRPDRAAPSSISASSRLGELSLPEQENGEQGRLAQTVAQGLQTGPNWVLLPNNAGVVVLVVPNSNVYSRPSSLQKRRCQRQITRREDCCDEYPPMQGILRQRQGA